MSKKEGGFVKTVFQEFGDDDCTMMAASLAYYTVFSLPPLLFIVVFLAGVIFGAAQVEDQVVSQAQSLIGPSAAEQVRTMLSNAGPESSSGGISMLASVLLLIFAATGVFAQLQAALNRAWEVKPDPEKGGVKSFIGKRMLSFGMILAIAFLLLVSLVLSAAIAAAGGLMGGMLPGGLSEGVLYALQFGVNLIVFGLLFMAIFKWMPDAKIAWRDVWVGAAVTAVLFIVGKIGLGIYLGSSSPAESIGAAGALAIIMLWVYYASMILLLGAEFTQVYAARYGSRIVPDEDAVRVVEQETHLRGEAAAQ